MTRRTSGLTQRQKGRPRVGGHQRRPSPSLGHWPRAGRAGLGWAKTEPPGQSGGRPPRWLLGAADGDQGPCACGWASSQGGARGRSRGGTHGGGWWRRPGSGYLGTKPRQQEGLRRLWARAEPGPRLLPSPDGIASWPPGRVGVTRPSVRVPPGEGLRLLVPVARPPARWPESRPRGCAVCCVSAEAPGGLCGRERGDPGAGPGRLLGAQLRRSGSAWGAQQPGTCNEPQKLNKVCCCDLGAATGAVPRVNATTAGQASGGSGRSRHPAALLTDGAVGGREGPRASTQRHGDAGAAFRGPGRRRLHGSWDFTGGD